MDLGAGDGRFIYEQAKHDSGTLYVAIDPDADALAEYAYRASRKPARGGVDNAVFVVASVEQLPPELQGLADLVYVIFPWGSLLRGLLLPEPPALAGLHSLLAPQGRFEIVLSYDPGHDHGAVTGTDLPAPDPGYFDKVLTPAYAASGLLIETIDHLDQREALSIPSNWGRRLLHSGREREVFRLRGRALSINLRAEPI